MNTESKRKDALLYHSEPVPGKIKVVPTKKYATQRDLSLAYSPGVAEPCLEIAKNVEDVYKYTAKGNLVAVISNGTAVLGLGDIGPEASKPVMEGKGLLFKIFADIDVFDIEVDATDIDLFINTVKAIAPTFGGINLEDIKAPESFEIERRLIEELDIPVMHDDQHGTAIISCAALINALELVNKKIEEVRIVINGAGAAAISCTRLYQSFGAHKENILMADSKGIIRSSRAGLTAEKKEFATDLEIDTLEEALKGADVFIGLSVADVMTPEMLLSMSENPIVFAMANPNPEIAYELAIATREDVLMATGRSDHPNQVNNVLGFPFIFRGALDVRATKINEAMKIAAVKAIADLAKLPVPEQVNVAYGHKKLHFGKEYIIPKPLDPRLISVVSPAVAKAAIASGVAKAPIQDWEAYENQLNNRLGLDNKLMRFLITRAKRDPKRVVFADAEHFNVLKAAQIVYDEGIAKPILLGNKAVIEGILKELEFEGKIDIVDPKSDKNAELVEAYAEKFWHSRERKGITLFDARKLMRERDYFGAMMVSEGSADALVTGYSKNYPTALVPMFEVIGKAEGVERVSSTNLMLTERGPLFLADTAINPHPTKMQIAEIALQTAKMVRMFGMEPIMAGVSHSNFGSAKVGNSDIAEAVKYLHENHPDIIIDGELQADFALNATMLKERFPFSKLTDKKVNTLIFPNLVSANITYKMIKELNKSDSIGPITLGMKKSCHIFQLGASVEEMVNMTVVAVVDAQVKSKQNS